MCIGIKNMFTFKALLHMTLLHSVSQNVMYHKTDPFCILSILLTLEFILRTRLNIDSSDTLGFNPPPLLQRWPVVDPSRGHFSLSLVRCHNKLLAFTLICMWRGNNIKYA